MSARRVFAALPLVFGSLVGFAGCADDEAPQAFDEPEVSTSKAKVDTCAPGRERGGIITALGFTRENPKGVTPGFNLDGVVSTGDDDASCRKVDFSSPDGTPGIDNQLAALIPDVEKVVGNAVDGLVQGAINDGQLIILTELDAVDDLKNDPCVHLTVQLGQGKVSLGTDGVIEGFQTFRFRDDSPKNHTDNGKIENGVLTAGPFELAVPLKLFDVSFTIHIHGAMFHAVIDDDGYMDGYFGGGIETQEILDGVVQGAGVDKIIGVISLVLKTSADMAPDASGKCQQISSALSFKAAPAFIRK